MQQRTMSIRLPSIAVAVCVTLAADVGVRGGENWTSYRGPTDHGHADATRMPLNWSEQENVVWKTKVPGKAWSSPVIWGDRIYLTNAPDHGSNLSVIFVDKNTGEVVYDERLHRVDLPQYCHPFNSYASPSPVVEEGRVYVSFGSPYNACLDSNTGEVIWERTDFVCNHFRGAGSSPLIYEDLLILHFDGSDFQFVVALDKQTGKTVWKTARTVDFQDLDADTGTPRADGDLRKAFSTPVIADVGGQPMLISLGSMALYAYDPETGEELWRADAIGSHSGACRPVPGHGLIFAPMGAGAFLWAMRPDGSGNVTDSHVEWTYRGAVPRRASLLLVDDLLFMVHDGGVAACVDATTGEENWKHRLGSNFSASPIFANGMIFFFDQDGKSTVIEAARKYKILAENKLDDGCLASPAVSNNALYVRTRSHLYRIQSDGAK